jgi:hypothetical protein
MDAQFAPILAIRLGMCLGLDILFLASGNSDFVKSFHFHLYYLGYIRTSWSACGQVICATWPARVC